MRVLFNGDLVPLTNGFGFVKADFDEAVNSYGNWLTKYNIKFKRTDLNDDFKSALLRLPPFQFYTKALLFKTKSNWVGYTNNAFGDPAIDKVNRIAEELKTEVLQVKAYPKTIHLNANGWSLGGFLYENFATKAYRSIFFSYQDRWDLDLVGNPLPFELLEKYKEKAVINRFTPEMLDRYCKALDVDFFNEEFYLGGKSNIVLFSEERELYKNELVQPLEEARRIYVIDPTL
jgi:hypothetical protein